MKPRFFHIMAAVLSMLALTLSATAFAGPATDVVKAKQTTLFDLLRQSTPDADKKAGAIIDEMLDYQALAEGSLGTEWAPRSAAEKAQFSDLLTQLVRRAYQRNLKKILNYNVEYIGEEASGGGVLVKTKSKAKDGDARAEAVDITFKAMQKGSAWKVVDIITAEESLVQSYRGQFTKIIKKDGFAVLIQKMKDKLAKDG